MCPISGMVQFLIVVVTLLLLCQATLVRSIQILFEPKNITINMYDTTKINYTLMDVEEAYSNLKLYSENSKIAGVKDGRGVYILSGLKGSFNLTGHFLGKTYVYCRNVEGKLDVTVVRKKRLIDVIFTSSVATLVSILYINFGCALNWSELIRFLKKPIGPIIGFISQFLLMPLLSFGLGKLLFPDNAAMQLGMFFTGVSPGGGASNIWTVVLDGNIDLSITMTTISTIAAFAMMPLWLFTLGKVLFDQGDVTVPYFHISTYAIALVIPLVIGYLISRYLKRVAAFLVRMLKCFSFILLLFIIIFAIVTNLYLFELFSWEIVVAGMGLPYLGYGVAYLIAKLLRQPDPDCIAIAVETGIQNTGIAIFLLRFTLPQPEADLTTIVPVSVATMTPLPLLILFIYKRIKTRLCPSHQKLNINREVFIDDNSNGCKPQGLIEVTS